jgi:signal transduction histidine kinase
MAMLTKEQTAIQKTFHVLVVEDNPADVDLACEMFSEDPTFQFKISVTSRLDETIDSVSENMPDAILLDLNLPDSQGLNTLTRLRTVLDDSVTVVVLTGVGDEKLGPTAIQLKAQDYLVKGRLSEGALPRTVRYSIERQRLQWSLRRIVSTNPDGIVVVGADGHILFANPATASLFGRPLVNMIGELFGFPVIGGEWAELNIGRDTVAEMRAVDIEWHGIPAYLVSLRDITERKQVENALARAKHETELASRAKTEFIANMSHELRTPLNSIIGFSDILMHEVYGPMGRPEYLGYAKDINYSGRHLLSLISDVLDASRIETGNMVLREDWIDPAQIMTACAWMVRDRAITAGISLIIDADDTLPLLLADDTRLKQILLNLMANSIKFTLKDGQVTCSAHVNIDSQMVFKVIDTGIGIAPENIGKAMSVFGQVDGSVSRNYEGVGLGLPLSKRLTELHGGTLTLESEKDVGTTVTVTFPAERTGEAKKKNTH